MISVFEIASALNRLESDEVDTSHTASIIFGNLSGLNKTETSDLWELARGLGYALQDIGWIGDDPETFKKIQELKKELNRLIDNDTCIFSLPDYLKDQFSFESFFPEKIHRAEQFEIRKCLSDSMLFVCMKDNRGFLKTFRKFDSIDTLEETLWVI